MILKGFRKFQDAITDETEFELGKNLRIDFSKETTDDEELACQFRYKVKSDI